MITPSKKERLIHILQNHTRVTIRPSATHGIGVFAITDIPKGTQGFFSDDTSEWIPLHKEEVAKLPAPSQALIENHCLFDETYYFVPEYGFRLMDLVVFINHADQPNIKSVEEGLDFIALRDIHEGEELFLDYGDIVDSSE